ncbi:MAG: ribonuclease HI [Aestuariivita sp.]|nr:ribonuclease HI [Aestuariivita sp.]
MLEIVAYTDGACSGNPGPGGWGVFLRATKEKKTIKERELYGGEANTTNNRMELMAAIKALETLSGSTPIKIYTDSKYVRDGVTNWMAKWKKNGWKTASKRPVKNLDLWQRLDAVQCEHKVTWEWIKGHAGHEGNERADWLARAGRDSV